MKITKIKLLNGEEIDFGDFNVFIGGNGVGKTTMVSEVFHQTASVPKSKYWWIDNLIYASDDIQLDLKLLKSSFSTQREGVNLFYNSNATKNIDGNVDLNGDFRFSVAEFEKLETLTEESIFALPKYRRPFISFSSCESRLNIASESDLVRYDQSPNNSLNVLHRNKALLLDIDGRIFEIFKYHFILLTHVGTHIQVGLSKGLPPSYNQNGNVQEEYQKIDSWKQDNFTPITEAGHGIRSMVRLLTSLLEPVNQVIVIDEPEMHLYPSQKRWLGRQLVQLASKQKKQVFLVTHDPMILQGILDANTKTNIFRVDRKDSGEGIIKYCQFNKADLTHAKNQEQYLQGLFYQRCIVVEGASDRSFYQELFEEYPEVQDKDLGVVVAGGVGNSKHMVDIAAKVGLKAAFIYDLDVLIENRPLLKDIFSTLGGTGYPFEEFEKVLEENEIISNAKEDDRIKTVKRVTGYQRKSGFSDNWLNDHKDSIDKTFQKLEAVGIFLVPNGTLESWAPDVEEKIRFAEQAPNIIRENEPLKVKFDVFAKKVLKYLDVE